MRNNNQWTILLLAFSCWDLILAPTWSMVRLEDPEKVIRIAPGQTVARFENLQRRSIERWKWIHREPQLQVIIEVQPEEPKEGGFELEEFIQGNNIFHIGMDPKSNTEEGFIVIEKFKKQKDGSKLVSGSQRLSWGTSERDPYVDPSDYVTYPVRIDTTSYDKEKGIEITKSLDFERYVDGITLSITESGHRKRKGEETKDEPPTLYEYGLYDPELSKPPQFVHLQPRYELEIPEFLPDGGIKYDRFYREMSEFDQKELKLYKITSLKPKGAAIDFIIEVKEVDQKVKGTQSNQTPQKESLKKEPLYKQTLFLPKGFSFESLNKKEESPKDSDTPKN